jgi:outer membrane protein TolC
MLSWEAFDFGLRGATVGLAEAQVTRARAGADLTRLEVGIRTADAFLRLAAAQETVRAARANVERQEVFSATASPCSSRTSCGPAPTILARRLSWRSPGFK